MEGPAGVRYFNINYILMMYTCIQEGVIKLLYKNDSRFATQMTAFGLYHLQQFTRITCWSRPHDASKQL
jgi:hypothetical protein